VLFVKLCVREPEPDSGRGVSVLDEVYGSVDDRPWYDDEMLLE
jgi:hypothetical protein